MIVDRLRFGLRFGCPGENPRTLPGQHKFIIASSATPMWGAVYRSTSAFPLAPLVRTLGLLRSNRDSTRWTGIRKPVCSAVGVFVAPQAPRNFREPLTLRSRQRTGSARASACRSGIGSGAASFGFAPGSWACRPYAVRSWRAALHLGYGRSLLRTRRHRPAGRP